MSGRPSTAPQYSCLSFAPSPPPRPRVYKGPRESNAIKACGWHGYRCAEVNKANATALRQQAPPDALMAVTKVAGVWRSFDERRKLKSQRILDDYRLKKFQIIQRFVRCTNAKVLLREKNKTFWQNWDDRMKKYEEARVLALNKFLQWHHQPFETAAIKVQRVFRWFLKNLHAGQRLSNEENVFPLAEHPDKRTFFPSGTLRQREQRERERAEQERREAEAAERRQMELEKRRAESQVAISEKGAIRVIPEFFRAVDPDVKRHSIGDVRVSFLPTRPSTAPVKGEMLGTVPLSFVLEQNEKIRQREQAAPMAGRSQEKPSKELQTDLDRKAMIMQRKYRNHSASSTVSSRKVLQEYLDKKANIIQRAVRCMLARCRHAVLMDRIHTTFTEKLKEFENDQIKDLERGYLWNRHQMDMGAITIQRASRYFLAKKKGQEPPANVTPPYGLLKEKAM